MKPVIFQAPIGNATTPELVAAVSNAGGFGMLAGTWRTPDELRASIRLIWASTRNPFAINLGVHASPSEKIELCLRENVPFISLFWGDARQYLEQIHRAGAKVIVTIGAAEEARAAVDAGADILIAQGWEAGGHVWGTISTMALIPEVVQAVPNAWVIAAGGIGNGKGIKAAMALGAKGACLGTKFLMASESAAHPEYQKLLIAATAHDTFYGNVFEKGWPNAPHRTLKNSSVVDFLKGEKASGETIAYAMDGAAIPRYSSRMPVKGMTGNIGAMALYAGQSVGHCRRVQPAAEIVRELMAEIDAAAVVEKQG